MGLLITNALKRGSNPYAGSITRGPDGSMSVDLGRVLSSTTGGDSAAFQPRIGAMTQALGNNPTVDALRNYQESYATTTGGDADEARTNVFQPTEGFSGQALDDAIRAFGIEEQGRNEAAAITKAGREKTQQINMGQGIASAQRAAASASEAGAVEGTGGGDQAPDVLQGSNVEETGGDGGDSNDAARKRRQSYGGAGLAMRI